LKFEFVEVPAEYSSPYEEEEYYEPCDECGGHVVATGGHGYYNGSYNCYTLYLRCENCGDYEVECV
jgi:hypothetical protein